VEEEDLGRRSADRAKRTEATVLSGEDEAIIVAFRRHTLLPLDDCLYSLQVEPLPPLVRGQWRGIPNLTRSSLHRCLQRHDVSRLPDVEGDKPARKKFKSYPIGFFHIDIAEVQTAEGKLYPYVGVDRTSKFAFAWLADKATTVTVRAFLDALAAAVPYKIETVLTDNGIQFADLPKNRSGLTARWRGHPFDRACQAHGIEHRLTKPRRPWTNGQVERMNRTIKDATVKRFHYDDHDQLRTHLQSFVAAYNFGRPLKTLKGLTPYEYICKRWTIEPERFIVDPIHQMPGPNI
jgi:transposase InsO family protein